jgi:serine/threonine protein kinase
MEEMYQSPADTIEGVYQQIVAMKTHHVKTSKEGAVLKEQLGEGEFGAVFRGEWMPVERHKDVAFKTLHKQTKENKMKLLQEAAIMGQFNHSNVVRLYGVIMSEEKVCIAVCKSHDRI